MKPINSIFIKRQVKLLLLLSTLLLIHSCQTEKGLYVCTPCDQQCDELTFSEPGSCPHCQMALIKNEDFVDREEVLSKKSEIITGSGSFYAEITKANEKRKVEIYYYKPHNFTGDSEIIVVIPGAGRNADTYRDSWIEASERHSLLILAPMYAQDDYNFDAYHLGGVIYDSNLENSIERIDGTNKIKLFEDKLTFKSNQNASEWLFNDFDYIFHKAVEMVDSKQTTYNLFGHSAGGHILHRFALFQEETKADKILASNASFYTLPELHIPYPFGLGNTAVDETLLKKAFKKNLVIFLGEADNANETGGSFLVSESANNQGHHRLERGIFFFEQAKKKAKELNTEFNWKLEIIPGVGHDHGRMGKSAAAYLYKE